MEILESERAALRFGVLKLRGRGWGAEEDETSS